MVRLCLLSISYDGYCTPFHVKSYVVMSSLCPEGLQSTGARLEGDGAEEARLPPSGIVGGIPGFLGG